MAATTSEARPWTTTFDTTADAINKPSSAAARENFKLQAARQLPVALAGVNHRRQIDSCNHRVDNNFCKARSQQREAKMQD